MLKWFGDNWGAACCTSAEHTETPTGRPCMRCNKPIAAEDRGFVMPLARGMTLAELTTTIEPIHLDCFLVSVLPEMSVFRASLLPKRASRTVHLLRFGVALCGQPGPPSEWPKGERWVSFNDPGEATCEKCLTAFARWNG